MTLVKVRINDILASTEKATLYLIGEREVWLPNRVAKPTKGWFILMEQNVAESRDLRFSPYIHTPPKIEATPNQEPIDELRYDPGSRD